MACKSGLMRVQVAERRPDLASIPATPQSVNCSHYQHLCTMSHVSVGHTCSLLTPLPHRTTSAQLVLDIHVTSPGQLADQQRGTSERRSVRRSHIRVNVRDINNSNYSLALNFLDKCIVFHLFTFHKPENPNTFSVSTFCALTGKQISIHLFYFA